MTSAHRRHRDQAGQSVVLVAVAGIALMAVAGLALDAGYEAGKYRQAQNAADSGALAAARLLFADLKSSSPTTPSQSDLDSAANREISHNGAVTGASASSGGGLITTAYAAGAGAAVGYTPFWQPINATVSAAVVTESASALGGAVSSSLALGYISGFAQSYNQPPQANALVETGDANVATPPTSAGGSVSCQQVTAGGSPATCANQITSLSSLSQTLPLVGTATVQQQTVSATAGNGTASVAEVNTLSNVTANSLGVVSATTSSGIATSNLNALGGLYMTDTYVAATSVSANLGGITFTADSLSNRTTVMPSLAPGQYAPLAQGTVTPWMTVTAHCVNAAVTIAGTAYPLSSSCQPPGNIPGGVASVSGPTTGTCTSPGVGNGVLCTASTCAASITLTAGTASVCFGKASTTLDLRPSPVLGGGCTTAPCCASGTCPPGCCTGGGGSDGGGGGGGSGGSGGGSGGSGGGGGGSGGGGGGSGGGSGGTSSPPTSGAIANAYTAVAHIDTPTFFLRVLGYTHTSPAATATAQILQVVDESQAAFDASPYAITSIATPMQSPYLPEALTPGHRYYLSGPQLSSYTTAGGTGFGPGSSWQGKVASTTSHRIGSILTAAAGGGGCGAGPTPYTSDGSEALVPVIDPGSHAIEYYAVFTALACGGAGSTGLVGTLVNAEPIAPSTTGTLVQAVTDTSIGWQPAVPGAVALKLTQ